MEGSMKVFFLGIYSEQGRKGLMKSSHQKRVDAVSNMFASVGATMSSAHWLMGKYDVMAEVEIDAYETAAGIRDAMMMTNSWDDLIFLAELDVDKVISTLNKVTYPGPGSE